VINFRHHLTAALRTRPGALRRRESELWSRFNWWRAIGLGFVLVCGMPGQPLRAGDAPDEYAVKATLLYNFTQFVEWPARAFAKPDDPLVIGIIGKDPFGATLENIAAREHADGHRIVVQQCRNTVEANRCHVLFVSATQRGELAQIVAGLRGHPILTVAEFEGFTTGGGMVRLYRNSGNKVRVQVNLEAVRAAGLSISSKLLRVVELVSSEEP
jgi:hypothetical protein